jgi:3'(2'), 5'-bisphosphate nucleotidase
MRDDNTFRTIESDGDLAARLATEAGRILLQVRGANLLSGKALGIAGDRTANKFLVHALCEQRPTDGILSEEEIDNVARLSMDRVWIVDPLDGSREYGEQRTDWAVHVALAVDAKATVGAVALPGVDIVMRSDRPGVVPSPPSVLRMVISRTRPANEATKLAAKLGASLVPMGSAGAKAMAVLRGEADIYLHSGGQYEWDSCAPVAVALGWGLHASRIDGSPLAYNCPNAYLPDLLICRKEHADRVLAAIAGLP